jgi:hypothetical protein
MHGQVKRIVAVIVLVASVTLLVGQSWGFIPDFVPPAWPQP